MNPMYIYNGEMCTPISLGLQLLLAAFLGSPWWGHSKMVI